MRKLRYILLTFLNCLSLAFAAVAETTVTVSTLDELQNALARKDVETIVLSNTLDLPDGTVLNSDTTPRKVIQVEKPFLPEDGKVEIDITYNEDTGVTTGSELVSPTNGAYSTYNLFNIAENCHVVISNVTLMGGFKGSRTADYTVTTGGIDNKGHLEMVGVDMLRTGTALVNHIGARASLFHCNVVRNANWYGGGILNLGADTDATDASSNGYIVLDCCSLTQNQSLGPAHGGGAAENQGLMVLNNCVVANNVSTEIGGGINNCKGGFLYVLNSTLVGNITTSSAYGTSAGGAIGNASGAGEVHIVNSIMAYNGYDNGSFVEASSLGRYEGSTDNPSCSIVSSVYDDVAGITVNIATNSTKDISGLIGSLDSEHGISAAGTTNGVTSAFTHPLLTSTDSTDPWALQPQMENLTEGHYLVGNATPTYLDYSKLFTDGTLIVAAYGESDDLTLLCPSGGDETIVTEEMLVTMTFDGSTRNPNSIGSGKVAIVTPGTGGDEVLAPNLFWVMLGDFTGGRVSGATIYRDSYESNTIVTVRAQPTSAYYLDGWMINDKEIPNTAQQHLFSFTLTTNVVVTPIFRPVETKIVRVRQRYPWNNLVDIDYLLEEKHAKDYRLVFMGSYETSPGVTNHFQLKSFVHRETPQEAYRSLRVGEEDPLRQHGSHRITWDSAKDGIKLKDKKVQFRLWACEGVEQ